MTTVAVMQPYYVPYAGYFRLFEVADVFVVYDCVQFPRRGYVHRNRLPDRQGRPAWLTMPLAKAPQATAIRDIRIAVDADRRLSTQRRRFPSLGDAQNDALVQGLLSPEGSLATFLTESLDAITKRLGLRSTIVRSSRLDIAPQLEGQDRVLEIVETLGGNRYVNASGGRALYDHASFRARGIELSFLSPFVSEQPWSILHHLVRSTPSQIAASIRSQVSLES